jgi:protein transport protein SEC20
LTKDRPKLRDDVLISDVEAFRAQLEANYGAVKKATAMSRRILEEKTQKELFSIRSKEESEAAGQLRQRKVDKENLSKKASSVTEDLLSISQMMSSQVSLSEQSLNTLVSSSATVSETQEEFRMMNSLLGQSRKLLSKYGRREVTDRVLIFFALAFFFGCCLYVILKRLPTIL